MLWAPLLVALLLALLTAGSYAELVTKYPRAGGAAVFAERAFRSPLVSFLVGFCMLAAGVVSAAGLAIAFAGDYFTTFVDLPAPLVAVVFLAVVGALNARGIRESMGANLVMTLVELSGLVIVIVVVATAIVARFWTPFDPQQVDISARWLPPGWPHVLGTDATGRDILSLIMAGGRGKTPKGAHHRR